MPAGPIDDRRSTLNIEALYRERDQLGERLEVARRNARHVPALQLDIWTKAAIALSVLLGVITTWPYAQMASRWTRGRRDDRVDYLSGSCSLACSAALSMALVMDEPDSPFELSAKQYLLFRASACLFGLLAVSMAIALALSRGGQGVVVFVLLGLGVCTFAAYGGAAVNDTRFLRVVGRIEKKIAATDDSPGVAVDARVALTQANRVGPLSFTGWLGCVC